MLYLILVGKKTVEGRPYKREWVSLKVGEFIQFPKLKVKVTKLIKYKTLKEHLDPEFSKALPNLSYDEAFKMYLDSGIKEDKPILSIHIKPWSQSLYPLWHGSKSKLESIKCFDSRLTDKPVCFGTFNKYVAAAFIARLPDEDFVFGRVNGEWIIKPRKPDALKALRVGGWLHQLEPYSFEKTDKLGLVEEYVSYSDQQVSKQLYVHSVYDYINGFIKIQPFEIKWLITQDLLVKYKLKVDTEVRFQKDVKGIEPDFNPVVHAPFMKPVVMNKDGQVVSGFKRVQVASYFNQEFAYVTQG